MLDTLLRVVGVDLQAQIGQLKAHAEAFKENTKNEIRQEITSAGVTAGLIFAAIVAAAWTCVVGLIALYLVVEAKEGRFIGLAAVGGVTAFAALVFISIASSRSKRRIQPPPRVIVAPAPAVATPRAPLNTVAASLMPPPPANASMVDVMAHRLSSRVVGATDEIIDSATDVIGHGSRTALIQTLAVAMLAGLIIGRRGTAQH